MSTSFGPFAAGNGLEHVLRSRETDFIVDGERGLPVAERPVQHEAAIDLHGAAEMHRPLAQLGIGERNIDLLEERGQRHVRRLVDDDAERAVLVVLADVRQRVRKVRVRHRRHGDQEVMREIGGRGPHGVGHSRNCKRRPLSAQLADPAGARQSSAPPPSIATFQLPSIGGTGATPASQLLLFVLARFLEFGNELLLQVGRRLLVMRELHRP